MTNNILFDLSEYLKDTDIFKFLLPIIDGYIDTHLKQKKS